jgi:hypothetical protein
MRFPAQAEVLDNIAMAVDVKAVLKRLVKDESENCPTLIGG